jgi:hypothetical protein
MRMISRIVLLAVISGLSTGCATGAPDDLADREGSAVAGTLLANDTHTVTVTQIDDQGVMTEVPKDRRNANYTILVPDGAGGAKTYVGTGDPFGKMVFLDVP